MKKALVSPNEQVLWLSGWTDESIPHPIYTPIANAQRIAQVEITPFEVAPPLFWTDCADDVVADLFYYDSVTHTINPTPEPTPRPTLTQPVSSGTQTL